MRHIELIADGVIASVKAFVSRETSVLAKAFNDRMAAWEARIAAIPAGPRGEKGDAGPAGERGADGAQGIAGVAGKDGAPGVQGLAGNDGDRGAAGADGQPGKSAYQLAVERGFSGTELQWLDSLSGKPGRDGLNGEDAAPVDTAAIAREAAALVPIPSDGKPGPAGKDVDPALLNDAIARKVADAVAKLPVPKDGRDGAPGGDGEPGRAGKDADPAIIAAMVAKGVAQALPDAVQRAIDALMPELIAKAAEAVPRPRDGRDGRDAPELDAVVEAVVKRLPDVKDGRDGRDAPPIDIDAVVAKAVSLIPVPVNGADGSSVTLDDVRPILEAETARWQLEFERRATDTLQRAVEKMPAPANGENGKDGQDAAQLETFDAVLDGRTLKLSLAAGDRVVTKEVNVPIPIYRGVFRSGSKYEESDMVTFAGAVWICMRDTATKPPSDDWKLCVAKGRDGKDAPA